MTDHSKDLEWWLSYIESVHAKSWDLGLERVSKVAQRLDVVRPAPVVVVVGGTNGKGSVCEYLSEFGVRNNLKVGKSTSPHMLDYNERIQINNELLPDEEIVDVFRLIESSREEISLTYFEFSALAAMLTFVREQVDVAILEIGLGGRLDAMNIVERDLSIITSISLDHESWLGSTREEIGKEKAGIMRPDVVCVLGDPDPPASLLNYAREQGVPLKKMGIDYGLFEGRVSLSRENFSIAKEAAGLLGWDLKSGPEIAEKKKLLGRKTWLKRRCPVILDVAHNPGAAQHLSRYLLDHKPEGKVHAIFGIYTDKNVEGVIDHLRGLVSCWHLVSNDEPRSHSSAELALFFSESERSNVMTYDKIGNVFDSVELRTVSDDLIVVFGSFFVVSAALKIWA